MTRIKLLFILTIFISSFAFGQADDKKMELKTELIGTWEFLELRDRDGVKVDTIWHGMAWELTIGPLLTYRADGTYTKQFTPKNTDTGKWYYDEDENAIIQLLYYSKPYGTAAQYLIDTGHAKKDENGDYYEIITDEVVELTEDKLIILEREGRQRTFMKKI